MKTKNIIEIVETPIIDTYEFHENNGIINPAFLEAHPGLEEDIISSQSLVATDYRQNSFKNGKTFVHYPSPLPVKTNQPLGNGTSIASSWVYEFNNGCNGTSTLRENMSGSSSSLTNMYRSAYDTGYNEHPIHLSYEMDLNRDHRKSSKKGCCTNRCCPTIVRIFVWTIIVLSLLGIAFSIAFIIYIERYAPDECCTNKNTTNSLYQNTGQSTVGPNSESNSTLLANKTRGQDMTTTISYSKSFFSTNGTTPSIPESTDNSSSDLLVTNSSLVVTDQNPILKLNDSKTTEYSKTRATTIPYISVTTPLKPDITPKMTIFSNNGTTPIEATITTTTTTTTTTVPTTTATTSLTDWISNRSSIRSIVNSEMPLTATTTTVSTTSTTIAPTTTLMSTSWTSNHPEVTPNNTDIHSRQMLYKEQQITYKMNPTESSLEMTTKAMDGEDYDIVDAVIKSIDLSEPKQNSTVPNN